MSAREGVCVCVCVPPCFGVSAHKEDGGGFTGVKFLPQIYPSYYHAQNVLIPVNFNPVHDVMKTLHQGEPDCLGFTLPRCSRHLISLA